MPGGNENVVLVFARFDPYARRLQAMLMLHSTSGPYWLAPPADKQELLVSIEEVRSCRLSSILIANP
jgi:hypothetical protein